MNEIEFPDPSELPAMPKRCILHWTAGAHRSSSLDRNHYHYLIEHLEGDPQTPADDRPNYVQGVPLENNMKQLTGNEDYAAHTRGFNSFSIGLTLCGMRGAEDHRPGGPVDPGPSPITRVQVRAMFNLLRQICAVYDLNPVEKEVFTHYEAQHLHGVEQAGKWDVGWVPGKRFAQNDVGPWIRRNLSTILDGGSLDY